MPRFLSYLILAAALTLLSACSSPPSIEQLSISQTSNELRRGSELVNGLAACGRCHGNVSVPTAELSGGMHMSDSFGEVIAPNITQLKEGGLGTWSPIEIVKAIRTSVAVSERLISPELHEGYQWMSDADVIAIVSYLKALPAKGEKHELRDITILGRYTHGLLISWPRDPGYVPEISRKHRKEYGEYLTDHVARCFICHNSPRETISAEEYLGGGRDVRVGERSKASPALQGAGSAIHGWSRDDVVIYLRSGLTPTGSEIDSDFCPVKFYRNAAADDLNAVAEYLTSLEQ